MFIICLYGNEQKMDYLSFPAGFDPFYQVYRFVKNNKKEIKQIFMVPVFNRIRKLDKNYLNFLEIKSPMIYAHS